jgi:hypothetical protein
VEAVNSPWFGALLIALPFIVAIPPGVAYVRQSELAQLRRWAREDGLRLTERRDLAAHYRAKGLWP